MQISFSLSYEDDKTNSFLIFSVYILFAGDKDEKDNTDNKSKPGGRKANDQG